jgi:hypothetical protein
MAEPPSGKSDLRPIRRTALIGVLVIAAALTNGRVAKAQSRQQYLHDNSPYCQNSPGLPYRPGPQGYGGTGNQNPFGGDCRPIPQPQPQPQPSNIAPPQFCSAETVGQIYNALLDFDRGLMDSATFGATKYARERLMSAEQAQITNEQAATAGEITGLVSALIPIPGLQEAEGARLTVTFKQFAQSTQVSAAVAKVVKANANLVWKLSSVKDRGEIIERVLAALEYGPRGYDWVGVLRGGTFRNIDFINYALKEQVSVKSMFRSTPESWSSGVSSMKTVIRDLAGVQKTWQTWTGQRLAPSCRAAVDSWKRVLDLRVPPGYENYVQDLVAYGQQYGIEVRIKTF